MYLFPTLITEKVDCYNRFCNVVWIIKNKWQHYDRVYIIFYSIVLFEYNAIMSNVKLSNANN